jgi:hypothetical protein
MQIVHMQPLVSSLSASECLVQPLRKELYFPYLYLIKSDVTHWHFKWKFTISLREIIKVLSIKKM